MSSSPRSCAPTTQHPPATFADFALPKKLLSALSQQGITTPFPIQRDTLPLALAGRDVVGRGQTGSGKTLAFVLPVLTRLYQTEQPKKPAPARVRALVLSPTRELAMQITDVVAPLAQLLGLRHALVCGGMSYARQMEALRTGTDVVIATPGRLADLIEQGNASLKHTQIVVIDEADHMADMGFLPEVCALLDRVPRGGQRLLFSATLDRGVGSLVDRYLVDPCEIHSDHAQASVTTMSHHGLLVQFRHKHHVLAQLAGRGQRSVVFVRTKRGADQTSRDLREAGVLAACLHGDMSQRQRNQVMAAFKQGLIPVLVATDVAARGIHVEQVDTVVQADPPGDHKDYLHRAGRTARAGNHGRVVTLVLPNQRRSMLALAENAGVTLRLQPARPGDATLTGLGFPAPDYERALPAITDEQLEAVLAQAQRQGHGQRRSERSERPTSARRQGERSGSGRRRGSSGRPTRTRKPSHPATNTRSETPRSTAHGTKRHSTSTQPRGKGRRAKRY